MYFIRTLSTFRPLGAQTQILMPVVLYYVAQLVNTGPVCEQQPKNTYP